MRFLVPILLTLLVSLPAAAVVDMKNANFADTWTDMIVPGSGYDLRIQRTYNSRSLHNGVFGFGWCSDFETKLDVMPEGYLKVKECGDGMEVTYTPKGFKASAVDETINKIVAEVAKKNSNVNKEYLKQLKEDLKENSGLREEFVKQMNLKGEVSAGKVFYANGRETETIVLKGEHYTRTLPDGTFQKFDKSGHLVYLYDRNSNYLKVVRSGELIAAVVDNNGRKLSFKYDDSSKKVEKIIGPNGMTSSYKIKGEELASVTNAWKNTFSYKYDELHNITKITYPDKTFKTLTYNKDKDWVTSFRNRKGCLESYEYKVDKNDPKDHYWSTVTKKCGKEVVNQSTYEFFHKTRSDGTGKYLYRVRSENNGNITDISYHEVFGKPTTILRNRHKTEYEYYGNGLVKSKKEPHRLMSFQYKGNKCDKVSGVKIAYFNPQKKSKKPVKTSSTIFRYDPKKCNLIFAKNSDGQTVRMKYDNKGRIAIIEDQSKKTVRIQYEERFGKPTVVSRPGLGTIHVSYKADGQIDKVKSDDDNPKVAVQVASVFNNLLEIIAPATSEASL